MKESKKTVTNAEVAFSAILDAAGADHIITGLMEAVGNLMGEESPMYEALEEASHLLSSASGVLYDLGYHGMDDDPAPFCRWVADPAEYGPCEDCAHCSAIEGETFTRCALDKGDARYAPHYNCHRFKAKDQ